MQESNYKRKADKPHIFLTKAMTIGGIFGGTHTFHTIGNNFRTLKTTNLITAVAISCASSGNSN
jgi:hypothetical protein